MLTQLHKYSLSFLLIFFLLSAELVVASSVSIKSKKNSTSKDLDQIDNETNNSIGIKKTNYEFRAGLEFGGALPLSSAAEVLDFGYGATLYISSNLLFTRNFSFVRSYLKEKHAKDIFLFWENGIYFHDGKSKRNYSGTSISAMFLPFIVSGGYRFKWQPTPKLKFQLIPKLGFGLSYIDSTIGAVQVSSTDFSLIPGFIFAYNFQKRFQVFLNTEMYIFFEEITGLKLRFQLGVNYHIF